MIIVKLLGGLGNQMFQYAVAKVIADKHNTEVKFDLRGLYAGEDTRKTFELDVFGIPEIQASHKEYFPFYRQSLFGSTILWNLIKKHKKFIHYKEKAFTYDPNLIKNSSPNMLLRGLFQSEKYFAFKRDLILKEFTFKNPLTDKNLSISKKIANENSVALHIRRGEFASDPQINKKIGTVPIDFYYKALNFIKENIQNPVFYIFSDTPEWVKKNFKIPKSSIIIDWNTEKSSYIDMQLMSLCKHNIIANSTFSWWAAWLNKNPNKIVIAPKKWFASFNYNTKDLIPQTWIKL